MRTDRPLDIVLAEDGVLLREGLAGLLTRFGHRVVASVVDAGDPLDLRAVLTDLAERGVERLMVEGGGTVHTRFLAAGLVDELHVVTAPFFVGDPAAPRFVNPASFPYDARNRMRLLEVRPMGDVVLARYQPVRTPEA
ncbi:RibD family protein [Streptosporangium algeriense]|uniref:RibD family protein n=1 Tax=Streptosporangium algeriense TaxID=1682748 RepID=A0ABW3DJC1_9ACTN